MAFRGQYEHSLDSKDRLTVPSAFREALSGEIVLAKGPDPCLWLMPKEDFEAMSAQYIAPHSPFGANARRLRRFFNANASQGELDSAGRVRIAGKLIEAAGLEGSCAVVGAGEYVEIWSADAWEKETELLESEFAEIAETMAGTVE